MNEVLDISQFRENNRYEAKLAQAGFREAFGKHILHLPIRTEV